MKNQLICFAALVPLIAAGCSKVGMEHGGRSGRVAREITFMAQNAPTRSVAETTTSNLNSFYGYFMDDDSHDTVPNSIQFTAVKNGALWTTGKFWPLGGCNFRFWAANKAFELYDDSTPAHPLMSFAAGLPTQDVVFAFADTSVDDQILYGQPVPLSFHHLFARVGSLTVNPQSGYTLSNVSASLRCAPASEYYWMDNCGSYSFGSDYGGFTSVCYWDDGDYDNALDMYMLPPPAFTAKTLNVGANDFLAIPGTYTLTVSYILTKGDYSESFIKTGSVTLQPGCINNITTTSVGGSAVELSLDISVQSWVSNTISAGLS